MNQGGCGLRRPMARACVLALIAALVALCGSLPVALEPATGPESSVSMPAELTADDTFAQATGPRTNRAALTDRSPAARPLTPSPPRHTARAAGSPGRPAALRPGVRNAANSRAHHTVLRC
ncbi:hypothetical protein ACH4OW_10940 [Streptomyces sp. NPDC017056]|uniref:hypothetical protein n=1 Tax=Streptomyces sp. NPDC017056 TaxID=3364973 RepID=UPI0037932C8B